MTLGAGDRVSADLLLIETRAFRAQEAALIGESVAVVNDTTAGEPGAMLGDRS